MRGIRIAVVALSIIVLPGAAFADANVKAFLYNPKADSVVLKYPYPRENDRTETHPYLFIAGTGIADGSYQCDYTIEKGHSVLLAGSFQTKTMMGMIIKDVKLDKRYPDAECVRWELKSKEAAPLCGVSPLKWSRFHGKVTFLDSNATSDAYIEMHSVGFNGPGKILIPVGKDGSFDELVPARVYHVMNINSTGYSFNAMERWAWDYDLTRDREDEFMIGRMELYSIHAFDIIGGPRTLLIAFRPSTLSRILLYDTDGNGVLEGKERDGLGEALKKSFTAIGPELKAENVKVWIDGQPQTVKQLTQMPEYDGDGIYQVLYIVQVMPSGRLMDVSHEIKLEVESEETLNGMKIRDFGQGSVGFYPLGYGQSLL